VIFAIAIALSLSAWKKHVRHKHAMEVYRQQLAEYNQKMAQQQAILDKASQNKVSPALDASASVPGNESASSESMQPTLQRVTQPATFDAATRPVKIADACTNFTDQLPSDYVLYAAGNYKGFKTASQLINSSGVGRFDVLVNAPGKKVVLALGAYEASVWNIQWLPSTTIVGVFLSGYYAQTISNLPKDIPVLNATYDSKSPCGYFYLTRENVNEVDRFLNKIFERSAQTYWLARSGQIDLGGTRSGTSATRASKATIEH